MIHHVENDGAESAHSLLTSISDRLKVRNKLIRIADKSEAEWLTVEEYQNDAATSDSDDSRKICQAKRIAPRKQISYQSYPQKLSILLLFPYIRKAKNDY